MRLLDNFGPVAWAAIVAVLTFIGYAFVRRPAEEESSADEEGQSPNSRLRSYRTQYFRRLLYPATATLVFVILAVYENVTGANLQKILVGDPATRLLCHLKFSWCPQESSKTQTPKSSGREFPSPVVTGRNATFNDDFTQDDALNPANWILDGPVAVAALRNFDSPPANIVTPVIAFSTTDGLALSGIKGSYQQLGIQSVKSFKPPFTVTARASAPFTGAGSLQFSIADETGSAGLSLNAGVGANQVFTGFWLGSPAGPGTQWRQIGKLSQTAPQPGIVYTLAIRVETSGTATASLASDGEGTKQATFAIGSGPFYLILSQGSGYHFGGESRAYWQSISITSP